MPYASDRDRNPRWAEIEQAPYPAPPLNLFMSSGYEPGVIDLAWDNPAYLSRNSRFCLCGINIYRSFDSEFGPYHRLTDVPIGATFWRDRTDVVVEEENIGDDAWVLRGIETTEAQGARYVLCTRYNPIVKSGSQGIWADSPEDVQVWIDGQEAKVLRVDGYSGQIEIDPYRYPNVELQNLDAAVIPGPDSEVVAVYRRVRNLVQTDLAQRIFYRLTTVGVPVTKPIETARPQDFVETPLERAAFTSNAEIEKLDYIWAEAVRRNRWILSQGGERVRVFVRKRAGIPCDCVTRPSSHQPQNDCIKCYGTGFLGGYEGPYAMVLAPDDAERRIMQRDVGRSVEHTYEVWTGPSPMLSQRDFLVKINGDRYSVGPVRMPSNRGMVLQQHFNIGHLDEKDIRYLVPMDNSRRDIVTETDAVIPPEHQPAEVTDKPNIPDERELRGRTATWENIEY
jgi:hypothetical protein